MVSGYSGQAPLAVQTYAAVFTALRCASASVSPSSVRAVNVPEKESPAPTVSTTSTCGVASVEDSPFLEMMVENVEPPVRITSVSYTHLTLPTTSRV